MNEPVSTMSALLTSIGSVVTAAVTWMGDFATAITSNDLLVLGVVAIPCVGLGVGLIRRLLKLRV